MNDLINNLFQSIYVSAVNLGNWAFNFYYNNIAAVQVVLLVFSGVLLFFIVFFIVRAEMVLHKVHRHMDIWGIADMPKVHATRFWKKILRRLKTEKPEQMKLAITDADKIFDEMAKILGYKGKNADERVAQLTEDRIPNLKDAMIAHNISNRIKEDPDFEISYDEARNIIKTFRKTFQDFGIID